MSRLVARFGQFGDQYNGPQIRQFVAELERSLSMVSIDSTHPRGSVAGGQTYAVTAQDNLLLCDTSSGNITVQLPIPNDQLVLQKFEVNVKKEASANALYITPTGGAVTDFGTDTIEIFNKGTSLCFRAVEDGWRIV